VVKNFRNTTSQAHYHDQCRGELEQPSPHLFYEYAFSRSGATRQVHLASPPTLTFVILGAAKNLLFVRRLEAIKGKLPYRLPACGSQGGVQSLP